MRAAVAPVAMRIATGATAVLHLRYAGCFRGMPRGPRTSANPYSSITEPK
ncbi:hypothetical protein [Streptomyces sp. NBC_00019]